MRQNYNNSTNYNIGFPQAKLCEKYIDAATFSVFIIYFIEYHATTYFSDFALIRPSKISMSVIGEGLFKFIISDYYNICS